MLKPEFPYKGNQIILSSDRVVLHSKNDAVFLFGKAAVGLSSTKTINLDANEEVYVSSPKIYLGNIPNFTEGFQPAVKGNDLSQELYEVFVKMVGLLDQLSTINETNFSAFATAVRYPSVKLRDYLKEKTIPNITSGKFLSKNIYLK
jgi:hypothetical protein